MNTHYDELSPEEARGRLDAFHVIDVRGDHEFHGPLGRIHGATLVPLPELDERAAELPSGRPLLLVCRSGKRSGKACELLAAQQVGPVVNLAGGMIAWNRAGLPVDDSEPATLGELLDAVSAWVAQVSGQTPGAVREQLGERLVELGSSLDAPSPGAVDRLLDFVDQTLSREGDPPPDLDLSLAAFRRALAVL